MHTFATVVVDMKKVFTLILSLVFAMGLYAAPRVFSIAGAVVDAASGEPVAGAAVQLGSDYLWTITDAKGRFHFENVYQGKYSAEASCLGYVSQSIEIDLIKNLDSLTFRLHPNSLALEEVTVTAQRPKDGLNTSRNIGRDALDHLQMSNMSDIAALLPGGKTVNPDLTSNNILSLRDGGQSIGNAAFGTAVEIDGVRFGNNASLNEPSGVGTRSVAVENIESIEVVTGVPSAEYGDLNSGMVKSLYHVFKFINAGSGSFVRRICCFWRKKSRRAVAPIIYKAFAGLWVCVHIFKCVKFLNRQEFNRGNSKFF